MDQFFIERASLLSGHYGIFDNTRLGDISKFANLPEVTISTVCNYLNYY